jgi:hypothetical protein
MLFLVIFLAGIFAGYAWRNYTAGILLGLGIGIIIMVLARLVISFGKNPDEPPANAGQEH